MGVVRGSLGLQRARSCPLGTTGTWGHVVAGHSAVRVSASASLSPNFMLGLSWCPPTSPPGGLRHRAPCPFLHLARSLALRGSEWAGIAPGRLGALPASGTPRRFPRCGFSLTPLPSPSKEFLGFRGEMLWLRKTPSRTEYRGATL